MSNEYKDWNRDYWLERLKVPANEDFINMLPLIRDGSTPVNQRTWLDVDKWCNTHRYMFMGYGYKNNQPIYILYDIMLNDAVYGPCTEEWLNKLRDSVS